MVREADLIVYHNNCPDGWCAAFIAKRKFPEAELLPMSHGEVFPFAKADGRNVLMVDFSLRTAQLNDNLAHIAKSFHILDHHKTAEAILAGKPYATFDLDRSGAGLTFDILFELESKTMGRPWYVAYVEDRDLWRHKLENSRAVNAFIGSFPMTIPQWEYFDTIGCEDAVTGGYAILRHIEQYVDKAVGQKKVAVFAGKKAFIVNVPYMGISDVCERLNKDGAEIAIGWFERADGLTQFSLRSTAGSDLDVSEIAKLYNGGGHKNAAGFTLPHYQGRELIDRITYGDFL